MEVGMCMYGEKKTTRRFFCSLIYCGCILSSVPTVTEIIIPYHSVGPQRRLCQWNDCIIF
jgi:hypothetical protein